MITNTELEYKGNLFPTALKNFKKSSNIIEFTAENGVKLMIEVIRDSILRFRYAPEGYFEKDFSYDIDDHPHGYNELNLEDQEDVVIITTSKVQCKVSKKDLRVGIYELDGSLILEDELGER